MNAVWRVRYFSKVCWKKWQPSIRISQIPEATIYTLLTQLFVFTSTCPKSLFILLPLFSFSHSLFGFALWTLKIWLPFVPPIYHTHILQMNSSYALIFWYNYVLSLFHQYSVFFYFYYINSHIICVELWMIL